MVKNLTVQVDTEQQTQVAVGHELLPKEPPLAEGLLIFRTSPEHASRKTTWSSSCFHSGLSPRGMQLVPGRTEAAPYFLTFRSEQREKPVGAQTRHRLDVGPQLFSLFLGSDWTN